MAFSQVSVAIAALSHTLLEQFSSLQAYLPAWWPEAAAGETAVRWATQLTTQQTQPIQTLLHHYPQRATIFSRLFANGRPPAENRFVPLESLTLTETAVSLYPHQSQEANREAYTKLLNDLTAGFQALQPLTDPTHYLLGLYDLLRRTTWCLPSPYAEPEAGISLFDHSRVVAALAPCYRPDLDQPSAETPVACLINGDISGIQSFIYTITARGATPGLRGRSFYLQLLTESLAAAILRRLHLPATSLLYAGGGHFFGVVPVETAETLPAIQQELSDILLRHHQGELYLALGWERFKAEDFLPANFGAAWSRLSRAVSRAKQRRFSELGAAMYEQVFAPKGRGGRQENDCHVCHAEGQMIEDEDRQDDTGQNIRKCHLCHSLEALGKALRQARGLWVQQVPTQKKERGTCHDTLQELGWKIKVLAEGEKLTVPGAETQLWAFHRETAEIAAHTLPHLPILRRHLVNVTPQVQQKDIDSHPNLVETEKLRRQQVKPFALLEQQACGIKRLGVLRMDVDDLGSIFSQGFGKTGGLAETAALSFALSFYFEGWVGQLAEQASDGRDVVYSIYSGGDDLFMVGAWDVLPQLAYRITQNLQRYAAHNPYIHASAGITLHGGKYPLYQAAREAESALEQAKSYRRGEQRKNAFTFLGRTYPWSDYPVIEEEFQFLKVLQSEKKAPQRLLQLLLHLDALYMRHRQKQLAAGKPAQQVYWGPWHWWSAYQLSRMAAAKQNEGIQNELKELRQKLSGQGFSHIELLGLSARWVELYLRGKNENAGQEEVRNGER